MLKLCLVVLLALVAITSAQSNICPPADVLLPCTCDDSTTRSEIRCERIEDFDIKATFDRISLYVNESTIFYELEIWYNHNMQEIPADTFATLKFREVRIAYNFGLNYISPDAFGATLAVTDYLSLSNNALTNAGDRERDIFDLINKFPLVDYVWLFGNNLTSVPDNAFAHNDFLSMMSLSSNQIRSIGSGAFTHLPNLADLRMRDNELGPNSIAVDAFQKFRGRVDLSYNRETRTLNETIFKPLLDSASVVEVGGSNCGPIGCTYLDMICDSRADWICENAESYNGRLYGYRCEFGNPPTVWEYCNGQK